MASVELPVWLVCAAVVPLLLGLLVLARVSWMTIRHLLARRPVPLHPLALRQQPEGATALLDEPPAECPTCKTPAVTVRRGDFTPTGKEYKLGNTEHFACENGHVWFGNNQASLLKRRMVAREKLQPVADDEASKAAKTKLAELDSAIVAKQLLDSAKADKE